ncbi:MAG: hypothetical protein LPJ97_03885, partial [Marinobacter sp.]|nr:hypothetical protein [Marinobacter sp.]
HNACKTLLPQTMAQNISIIEIDGTRQLIQLSSADDLQAALEDFRKACGAADAENMDMHGCPQNR